MAVHVTARRIIAVRVGQGKGSSPSTTGGWNLSLVR